jgi:RimJ/RimL family protein N-acetyltransferase
MAIKSRVLEFEDVRQLAEIAAKEEWAEFLSGNQSVFEYETLGAEHAWMFFRNRRINIPESASLKKCAIVVSKLGEVRYVADFYPDFEKAMDYLNSMSEHFKERGI